MTLNLIPRFSASFLASDWVWEEEYLEGMETPSTFSLPSASTAMTVVSDESMPPLMPTIACLKLFL